jgi:5,10-methylenetetrahydromethanopterin reductase
VSLATVVDVPLRDVAARAAAAERHGFDRLWLPDERLTRNVYTALTVAALSTTKIELGVGVTNPYTRNPALTAAAAATVDELSGGRLSLGFGAGGGLDHYGVARREPVRAVREAIEIVRRLTAGERVDHSGRHFTMRDAGLDFPALRTVPVYVAARGPRLLELAGEVADGAILGGFASPRGLAYALAAVETGIRRRSALTPRPQVVAWLYASVADDSRAARAAVAGLVAASLMTSRSILERIGIELPAAFRRHVEATGWSLAPESMAAAARLVSEDLIDDFSVAGTPAECRAKLKAIAAEGVDEIALVALPGERQSADDVAARLAADVLPGIHGFQEDSFERTS